MSLFALGFLHVYGAKSLLASDPPVHVACFHPIVYSCIYIKRVSITDEGEMAKSRFLFTKSKRVRVLYFLVEIYVEMFVRTRTSVFVTPINVLFYPAVVTKIDIEVYCTRKYRM